MKANKPKDTGLLKGEEYRLRYSDTLIKDPKARLDENLEINKYLNKQGLEYRKELDSLSQLNEPLGQDTRVIVTIIAYGEGNRIKSTLEKYLNQDINPSLFEIVLLDNHPETAHRDNTQEEVSKFIKENPQVKVIYSHKAWSKGEPATVGNARKHVFDIALNRIAKRDQSRDTIIFSHDADPLFYETNYLSSILDQFDKKPNIDALVANMSRPEDALAKPNVYIAVETLRLLEEELIKENKELGEPADPALFLGGNGAMRASIVAAVGGSNPNATVNDDREMGWLIADAREWNPECIISFRGTGMITDARRFMDSIANELPTDMMMMGFNTKPEIRQLDNEKLLSLIPDDIVWELLEEDLGSSWASQYSGNKLYAKKFPDAFKKSMETLGIEYAIVDDRLVLKNVNKLLKKLSTIYGREVGIKHCAPFIYTPEMIREIKPFFESLSKGAVEARKISIGR